MVGAGVDRKRLVEEAVPWVAAIARKVKRKWPSASLDDLVALGNLAAAEAAESYQASQGAFQQYAFKSVWGAMTNEAIRGRYGHDAQLTRVVSAYCRDEEYKVESIEEFMKSSIGGLGVTEREMARDHVRQQMVPMLIASARLEAEAQALDPSEQLERAQLLHTVRETVEGLDASQRAFFEWFYGHDETLEAIAKRGVAPTKDLKRFHQKLKERVALRMAAHGRARRAAAPTSSPAP